MLRHLLIMVVFSLLILGVMICLLMCLVRWPKNCVSFGLLLSWKNAVRMLCCLTWLSLVMASVTAVGLGGQENYVLLLVFRRVAGLLLAMISSIGRTAGRWWKNCLVSSSLRRRPAFRLWMVLSLMSLLMLTAWVRCLNLTNRSRLFSNCADIRRRSVNLACPTGI